MRIVGLRILMLISSSSGARDFIVVIFLIGVEIHVFSKFFVAQKGPVGVGEIHTDFGILSRDLDYDITIIILVRIHDTRVLDDIRGVQREADHLQNVT